MREIKFRAFDIDHNQMIYLDRLDITGDGFGWWDDEDGNEHGVTACHLMQFTGLLDKNGKEIFEGDIVRRATGYNFEVKIRRYSIGTRVVVNGFEIEPNMDEVLGNIYENPELLK